MSKANGDKGGNLAHMLDRELSDRMARAALQNGWTVSRRTATYFVATRIVHVNGEDPVNEQISTSVRDGDLQASYMEVLDATNNVDRVVGWMEES